MGDEDTPLNEGFCWKDGKAAVTKGVNIWSEAFIVEKDGTEVRLFHFAGNSFELL